MVNANEFTGREYAGMLEELLIPLKQVSQLNIEKAEWKKRYKWKLKSAGDRTGYVILGGLVGVVLGYLLSGGAIGGTLLSLLTIAPVFGVISYFISNKYIVKPRVNKIGNELNEKINMIDGRINEIIGPFLPKLREYVPQQYWYYYAVSTMYGYLVDGRADSWKEAMNLFEVTQHQQRLEHSAEIQAEYAAITAANSRITAAATTATAINTFFN